MKWSNPWLYLMGALATLGPVGVRLLTLSDPPAHALDADMVREGDKLFNHEWTANDPLAPNGDGLGPVFNATSCVACHHQGGSGGGGGTEHNVVTYVVRPQREGDTVVQGVIHAFATAPEYEETMRKIHPALPPVSRGDGTPRIAGEGRKITGTLVFANVSNVQFSERNTPALFGARLIDELPERVIIAGERAQRLRWGLASGDSEKLPVGKAPRLPDGRVGKFGWKAQSASLSDFVQAACANELGLGNPSNAQPQPLGNKDYKAPGLDLTLEQCNQMTAFIASLPRPVERLSLDPQERDTAEHGKRLFMKIGCAECHTPNLGSIEGIYSDLLLHRMGDKLESVATSYYGAHQRGPAPSTPSAGPRPDEWRTPPLWGLADSGPYLHDGRADTLAEAISLHGGQARSAASRFQTLPQADQHAVLEFLQSLRAPGAP